MSISSIKTGLIRDELLVGNPPFSPSSYESIATVLGNGSSSTLTFSGIPSTFQHLQIRCLTRVTSTGTSAGTLEMRFNGVSTSSYTLHGMRAFWTGSTWSAGAAQATGATATAAGYAIAGSLGGQDNMFSVSIIDIDNYVSTTANKTVRWYAGTELNSNESGVWIGSGLFINTNAISSISLIAGSAFTTSSVFALYGIKGTL